MRKLRFLSLAAAAVLALGSAAAAQSPALLTKAEATEYKATSLHADVKAFIDGLVKLSPMVRTEIIGRTAGGFDIPALIVAAPPVSKPEQLRNDRRKVIYIQANIHAGEVEGKESVLMLARDIVTAKKPPYLDKFVLIIVPNLNADGNEKVDPRNRSYQPGPAEGVGIRTNDWNLDLNRDGMKLESPEIAAVVKNIYLPWDPILFVDCHTTDGSFHQEVVTYSWGVNPNGDPGILAFLRDVMMPAVDKIAEEKYQTLSTGYGGFQSEKEPEKGWMSLDPQPRFGTNYYGLRNRFSILIENYVFADFKTRVWGNYRFLQSILDFTSDHLEEMNKVIAEADARAARRGQNPGAEDVFGLEFDVRPTKEPLTVHAIETEVIRVEGQPRPTRRPTGKVNLYTVPYFSDFFIKRSIPFAAGYLVPVTEPAVLDLLLRHGLKVERLKDKADVEVEAFKIKENKPAERLYQGHRTNLLKGDYVKTTISFPSGTLYVSTAQPLGGLAAYLLEPESDDGLVLWNYFDKFLASSWGGGGAGTNVPVFRLLKPLALPVVPVK